MTIATKWRDYLALGRPSNLPTVWTNVLAGGVLSGATESSARELAHLALAMSLAYTGGMFLNDAFDREIDRVERPERPIPSGRVRAGEAFAIGAGLLVAAIVLIAVRHGSGPALIAAVVLGATVVVYDAWHKQNPGAPVIMGACRALVYLTAGAALSGRIDRELAIGAGVLASYVVGLTFVARQENLASFRGFWPLLCLIAPLVWALPSAFEGLTPALLFFSLLAWMIAAVARLLERRTGNIGRVVVSLIAGISLVDALAIATHGQGLLAIAAAGGLFATLFLQRYVRGT